MVEAVDLVSYPRDGAPNLIGHGVRLLMDTNTQNIGTNTNDDLTWDTVDFEVGDWVDLGTSAVNITVPAAYDGRFVLLSLNVGGGKSTTLGSNEGKIQLNGTNIAQSRTRDTDSFWSVNCSSGPIQVATGDVFKAQVRIQIAGGTVTANAARTFSLVVVG